MEYKEKYTPEQITNKLKQVEEFETKYGKSLRTKAIRKWCTDPNYRKREWEFRQATINLFNFNTRNRI